MTHDIQSQITLKKMRTCYARTFLVHFNISKLKHGFLGFGRSKLGNLTSKHIKPNVFKNYCTCAYNIL